MKKIAILMVLMMGLLALAGCSSDNESRMVDYTLTTNVTDGNTGDAIEGATVSADGKEETTDANGLAQIDLSYGGYEVSVNKDGYIPALEDISINGSDSTLDMSIFEGTTDGEVTLDGESWGIWSEGRTTASIQNGSVVLDVSELGDTWWKTQFFKEGIAIPEAGTYVITFEAKAANPRDIRLEVVPTEVAITPGTPGYFDFSLTDTMQTYQASFEFSGLGANPVYKLNFGLGKISDVSVPSTVIIDSIEVNKGSALPKSELTVNVTDGTNALEGVEVAIQPINTVAPETTDTSGNAVFNLEDRQYTVEASLTDYQTATKTLVLDGDMTVDLVLEEVQAATGDGYLYASDEIPDGSKELTSTIDNWGSDTTIDSNYTDDAVYSPCIKLTSGTSWGDASALAFIGMDEGTILQYEKLRFKIKTSDYTTVQVKIPGSSVEGEQIQYTIADGKDLGNGWTEMEIPFSDFGTINSTNNEFAILEFGAGEMLITDVCFVSAN
ncbi:DUF3869 domain-containing protein [Halanaerobium saccharolyticum]|uniref:DUF3869 domain-containing protein n=1 Tax=Halanaerobium saccharolyticum TaxID=43595 RepID=UPI003FCE0FF4